MKENICIIYRHSWANLNCLCWFPNLIVSIEKQKIFVHWVYKLVPSLQDSKNLYGTQDEFSHKKVKVRDPEFSQNPMKSTMYLMYTTNRI